MPKEKTPEAYLIKFDSPDLNGLHRIVEFVNGHGVLDSRAMAATRPDLYDRQTLKPLVAFDIMGDIAKFWGERGAKVEPCSGKEAEAYRAKLHSNPTGHVKKAKAPKAPKAPKASTTGAASKAPPHKKGK